MNGSISRTELIRLIRRLDEYEEWRRQVFIRDRFTCQHCGARNGRKRVIEADHIKSISDLVSEFGITSVETALKCPAIWDINNGRTLCHSCHEKTESYPTNFKGVSRKRKVLK